MAGVTFSFYESEEEADWYDFSAEEYFWATIFPRPHRLYTDQSGESLWYFNLNMYLATIEAYRKMGNTKTAYKFFQIADKSPALARGALRAAPAAAVAYVAAHATHDLVQMSLNMTAHEVTELQTPGFSTATTASVKPWWMPLPVFVALYG